MKTVKIALCVLLLFSVLMLSACAYNPEGSSDVSSEVVSALSQEECDNNLDGLVKYIASAGYISGEPLDMEAGMIGAAAGKKYSFSFNGSAVTAEFYEYDLDNLSDGAKNVLKDVDEKGTFTMLNIEVKATRSTSGKYLMVYTDASTKTENTERTEAVKELFTGFYAG